MENKSRISQYGMPEKISPEERETKRREQIRQNIANLNEATILAAQNPEAQLKALCADLDIDQKNIIAKQIAYVLDILTAFDSQLQTIFPSFFAKEFIKDKRGNDIEIYKFREGFI